MEMQRRLSTGLSNFELFDESTTSVFNDTMPIIKGYIKKICNKYRKKDCQTQVKITKSTDDLCNLDLDEPAESMHFDRKHKQQENTEYKKAEEYVLEIINNPVDEIAQEMQEDFKEPQTKTIKIKIIVTNESSKYDNETKNNSISDDKKVANKKICVDVVIETPDDDSEYYAKVCTSEDVNEEIGWITPEKFKPIEYSSTISEAATQNVGSTDNSFLGNQTLSNTIKENETKQAFVQNSLSNDDCSTHIALATTSKDVAEKKRSPSILVRKAKGIVDGENSKNSNSPPRKVSFEDDLPTKEQEGSNEDSIIIHDIVMERFQKTLSESMQRKAKRLSKKDFSLSDDIKINENKISLEHINGHINQDKPMEKPKAISFDSGFQDTMVLELVKSNSSEHCKDSEEDKGLVEYDSREFLSAALGDELLNKTYESQETINASSTPINPRKVSIQGSERSIGSSDVTMLLSNIDESVYSLYSTIKKPIKNKSIVEKMNTARPLFNSFSSFNDYDYASFSNVRLSQDVEKLTKEMYGLQNTTTKKPIRNKSVIEKMNAARPLFNSFSSCNDYDYASISKVRLSQDVEKLTKEMYALQKTTYQVTKALSLCRNNPKVFGGIPHIEAEKVLLVALHKQHVITSEINTGEYQEIELGQYFGIIRIGFLKFSTELKAAEEQNVKQYFLCLLRSGVTVLASDVTTPDTDGVVEFANQFQFDKLVSDFEIHLSIYGMDIEINETDTNSGLKRKGSLRKNKKPVYNDPTYTETLSLFRLLGTCKIGKAEVTQGLDLKLTNMSPDTTLSDSFVADIRGSVELRDRYVGFLNIRTSCSPWEKRWCILDGRLLKYWNYPSDEYVKKPIGTIDLSHCATYQVSGVDKRICSRPRTLKLEINVEGANPAEKIYLFSADSLEEFNEWKSQLNSRLATLRYWDSLKSQGTHTNI